MFSVVCIEIAATAQEYGSHPTERRRYAQHALHVGVAQGSRRSRSSGSGESRNGNELTLW
jgi:hypothetical protein